VVEIKIASEASAVTVDSQQAIATRDQLERGFRRLTTDQRAVIVLRHYLGLSLAESAEVLGIPLGTMQSRLNRATQAMRAALEADDRPGPVAVEGVR
jgi:RNA polymerase sigma-70 factor (ECF subfamily)